MDIDTGDNFSAAVDHNGRLFTWGYGNDGQLGHGNRNDLASPMLLKFDEKIKQISCGDSHAGFITNNNELYIYGSGKYGEHGRADSTESQAGYRTSPVLVDFFTKNGYAVNRICCGGSHNIASVYNRSK